MYKLFTATSLSENACVNAPWLPIITHCLSSTPSMVGRSKSNHCLALRQSGRHSSTMFDHVDIDVAPFKFVFPNLEPVADKPATKVPSHIRSIPVFVDWFWELRQKVKHSLSFIVLSLYQNLLAPNQGYGFISKSSNYWSYVMDSQWLVNQCHGLTS